MKNYDKFTEKPAIKINEEGYKLLGRISLIILL